MRSGSPDAGGPTSPPSRAASRATSRTSGSSDERAAPPDDRSGRVHEPVLLAEVLAQLDPREGGRFLDGTVGGGGHAEAILDRSAPDGRLLGLDVDPAALAEARRVLERFGDRAVLDQGNFALLDVLARERGFDQLDGVLLDLGLSSIQLADSRRGFSFRAEGPLDMRADPGLRVTAADVVNSWDQNDLRDVFARYGEEPEAARIAAAIVRRRTREPFLTADDLGRFVYGVKQHKRRGGSDPATRVFQSLRIAVNDELSNLQKGLVAATSILRPGGRLAVIAFQSLEDRTVKQFFARESRDCICPPHLPTCVCGHRAGLRVVTRRPLRADSAEAA
ncbi:MAG: 16S rRNA (cytosine(1402)-N(4))-methyltransferase RsmH, partial [Chloroflexota bacterium]|nr:16S rRNA (cytosine(1402)-N(4))-methyltransferase RsmH [Chloroflexota bacterium]